MRDQHSELRELNPDELGIVSGGVSQDTAINTNLAIIGIGVGILAAGATAPAWFPIAMMGVGVAAVVSYAME
ncbi:hypothetical protein [Phyllobacterium zundukense]|uniref:Bacteriocin n=1 Tax=Phyllobacterium zundukense TaxID=1867719 RepID=A0A2N9W304_9HYPH|nr:hypothetical protein [Phyllobacterium zundukense]ATU94111.1 hypothetical protein BLM14_20225 [Phyllobacterium zundukense]PIO46122.1 hypothetical protein B5P45_04025 [Phyllobacterium zundukense]